MSTKSTKWICVTRMVRLSESSDVNLSNEFLSRVNAVVVIRYCLRAFFSTAAASGLKMSFKDMSSLNHKEVFGWVQWSLILFCGTF